MKDLSKTLSLFDAYSVLSLHSKNVSDIKAWKLGGTNNSLESEDNNFTITVGYLREQNVYKLDLFSPEYLNNKLIEIELVVKLNDDLILNDNQRVHAKDHISYYLGIECPQFDVAVENLNGAVGNILKNCSAGELYVSEVPVVVNDIFEFLKSSKEFEFIGLKGEPEEILSDFLFLARRFDFPLQKGQLVSLGGLTRIQPAVQVGNVLSRARLGAH